MVLKCINLSSGDWFPVHENIYLAIKGVSNLVVILGMIMKMITVSHAFVNLLVILLSFFSYESGFIKCTWFVGLKLGKL